MKMIITHHFFTSMMRALARCIELAQEQSIKEDMCRNQNQFIGCQIISISRHFICDSSEFCWCQFLIHVINNRNSYWQGKFQVLCILVTNNFFHIFIIQNLIRQHVVSKVWIAKRKIRKKRTLCTGNTLRSYIWGNFGIVVQSVPTLSYISRLSCTFKCLRLVNSNHWILHPLFFSIL